MKIALFCAKRPVLEIQNLYSELRARGHSVVFIDSVGLSPSNFRAEEIKEKFSSFDLIYYRTGFGDAGKLRLATVLADCGTKIINRALFLHPQCENKLYQMIFATENGITIPETRFSRDETFAGLSEELGAPFILKAARGIQGKEVFLIKNEAEYKEVSSSLKGDLLYQRFVKNQGDYRVFVIGEKVHAIFKRVAAPDQFKNNISLGATGEAVTDEELRQHLSKIALTICQALSIEIGGVDIIQDSESGELYFLEVNVNPGWKGLDDILKTNTATAIADYFETVV